MSEETTRARATRQHTTLGYRTAVLQALSVSEAPADVIAERVAAAGLDVPPSRATLDNLASSGLVEVTGYAEPTTRIYALTDAGRIVAEQDRAALLGLLTMHAERPAPLFRHVSHKATCSVCGIKQWTTRSGALQSHRNKNGEKCEPPPVRKAMRRKATIEDVEAAIEALERAGQKPTNAAIARLVGLTREYVRRLRNKYLTERGGQP